MHKKPMPFLCARNVLIGKRLVGMIFRFEMHEHNDNACKKSRRGIMNIYENRHEPSEFWYNVTI